MKTRLADLVSGHPRATQFLASAMSHNQIPQSILITGAEQVGKATLARTFATALNCQGDHKPCHQCPSCRKALNGNHPDIVQLDEPNETLRIEQVREIQRYLVLRPLESTYKVAILANFERATPAAANALLKTLEEPPAHVLLLLTAKSKSHLLPTIASRCQILPLKPVAETTIASVLKKQQSTDLDQVNLLSKLAMGRIGWAIEALSQDDVLARREQSLADILEIMAKEADFRLKYAQDFTSNQNPMSETIGLWLALWRDILYVRLGDPELVVNIDIVDTLGWFAKQLTINQIVATLNQLQKTLHNLSYNVNVRLNFEVLLLNLPRLEMRLV